jgi:mRNA interferase RelE/StbE
MTYELKFIPSALKEWNKLDSSIRTVFKKALAKRLINPIVPLAKIRDKPIVCYKIKLRTVGYRLVYTIENNELSVLVLIVDRRDVVYKKLDEKLKKH